MNFLLNIVRIIFGVTIYPWLVAFTKPTEEEMKSGYVGHLLGVAMISIQIFVVLCGVGGYYLVRWIFS